MGIPSVSTTNVGIEPKASKSSNHGTIIGIVVAAVVLLGAIAVATLLFFWIRKRNKKREGKNENTAAAKEAEEAAERIRQGFDKPELGAAADHTRYEMAGSQLVPNWVTEKADLAEHPRAPELTGENAAIAELADPKRSVHEMYDPSAAPVELPAEMPQELLASVSRQRSLRSAASLKSARQSPPIRSGPSPISSPSSRPSTIDRRMGRAPQSRSSTLSSQPFAPSPNSRSGPSSPTDRSLTSSPRSPSMGDSGSECRSPVEQIPLSELVLDLSQNSPFPRGTGSGSQRSARSALASSLMVQDARRKRRNEF